jgi:hypothetical protein
MVRVGRFWGLMGVAGLLVGCGRDVGDIVRTVLDHNHEDNRGKGNRDEGGHGGGSNDAGAGGGATAGAGGGSAGATGTGGAGGSAGAAGAGGAPDAAVGCAANALTNCTGTAAGAWCVDHLFSSGEVSTVVNNGVWSSGPTDTWVVGNQGTQPAPGMFISSPFAFHWDGCAWTRAPLPGTQASGLNDVWGAAPNDVWAVGDGGLAFHFDGTSWTQTSLGTTANLVAVSGTGGHDVWVVGQSGAFHFNGATWTNTLPGGVGGDVWAVAPNDVWATNDSSNVMHWAGAGWTTVDTGSAFPAFGLFGIWADASQVWAVGEGSQIFHFAQSVWTQVQPPGGSAEGLTNVMAEGQDVFAVRQQVARSTAGGPFVSDGTVPQGVNYPGVWLTPTQVWISGDNALVLHEAR